MFNWWRKKREKTVLQAGLTKECMQRIMAGEIERIDVDADTVLEIRYVDRIATLPAGTRGKGMYLFPDCRE